jgi:hypothetical protein
MLHEIGHGLGLDHSDTPNLTVMEERYEDIAIEWPATDDISGVMYLYAPPGGPAGYPDPIYDIMWLKPWTFTTTLNAKGNAKVNGAFFNDAAHARTEAGGLSVEGDSADVIIDFWRPFKMIVTNEDEVYPIPTQVDGFLRGNVNGELFAVGNSWSIVEANAWISDVVSWTNPENNKVNGIFGGITKPISWTIYDKGTFNIGQEYELRGRLHLHSAASRGINNYAYADFWNSMKVTVQPIPEPCTMLLMGSGLAGLAGIARRRKKS